MQLQHDDFERVRQYAEYLIGVRGAAAAAQEALAGPDVAKLAVLDVLVPCEAQRLLDELPAGLGDDPAGERRQAWRARADAALRAIWQRMSHDRVAA